MGTERVGCPMVECFSGCVLVWSGSCVRPGHGAGMVWLGEAVLDAVLVAHAVERVLHGVPLGRGILGERHAVVGEHATDLAGEGLDDAARLGRRRKVWTTPQGLDDAAEEGGALHLAWAVMELGRPANLVTRSMARNMWMTPAAERSWALSMWT